MHADTCQKRSTAAGRPFSEEQAKTEQQHRFHKPVNSTESSTWVGSQGHRRCPQCDFEGTLDASVTGCDSTDKQEGKWETPATKGPLRKKVQQEDPVSFSLEGGEQVSTNYAEQGKGSSLSSRYRN